MQKSMCPFCEEQKNRGISIINKSRILAETDNFVVFPTTGGFVENYQLIVPKNHINCFGELSKEQLVELKSIILWQQEINRKYFNSNSSMFEHGALHPSNESGKSIVHAHLHIFPNNISLLDEIKKYNFNIQSIEDIEQLSVLCQKYDNYLYYSDIDGKDYIITHEGIPSQFLRMLLAKSRGIEIWNWRDYPLIEVIENDLEFYKENSLIYTKKKEGVK